MTAVAVIEKGEVPAVQTSVRAVGLLRPLANPADIVQAQNDTRAMVHAALKEGRDFGVVPGTDKATLFKPGAERCALGFGLAPRFRVIEQEIDHDRRVEYVKRKKVYRNQHSGDKSYDWKEEAGVSLGLYRYVIECEMVQREAGVVIAACIGSCSSMESKYVDRPRDVENTIIKMAEKRAFVGATILALGLSDEFTQDVEDLAANGVIDGNKPDPVAAQGNAQQPAASDEPEAKCPKCSGLMWDNRTKKTNPKAPDFKCRDKGCEGVFWPGQWPPKAPDASQTDAFDTSSAAEKLTRDSVFPRGPYANSKVRDLPIDFLKWAIGDERNLGDRTPDWQDIFNLEIDERAVEAREAAEPVSPAKAASDAALGVTETEKPKLRQTRAQLVASDDIPF